MATTMSCSTEVLEASDSLFIINNLAITDPDVIDFLQSLDGADRMSAVSTAIHFGLLALRDFGSVTKTDWIDKRFQMFESEIQSRLDAAGQKLEAFLGNNGELERAFTDSDGPIRSLLDPSKDGSPISELSNSIRTDIQALRDELVGERAREEEAEKGTRKGFQFEDQVFEFLQPICANMGDTIRMVGKKKVAGRMVGDLAIEVNERHMEQSYCIVIEAKAGTVSAYGTNGLLEQMETAMEIRDAQYAIGVVRQQENMKGIDGNFAHIQPNKILCAFDLDGCALELAYRLARTEVLLQAHGELRLDSPTRAGIVQKLADAKRSIDALSKVKAHASRMEKSAQEIKNQIDTIRTDVLRCLGEVESVISSCDE